MSDTYGELDVLFITTPSMPNPSKSKRRKDNTCNTLKQIKQSRIRAKQFRAKRKSQFLLSIKYSESLLKQNAKIKEQICLLKKQLNDLIMLCRHRNININK